MYIVPRRENPTVVSVVSLELLAGRNETIARYFLVLRPFVVKLLTTLNDPLITGLTTVCD